MKFIRLFSPLLWSVLILMALSPRAGAVEHLRLSTTTSTENTGLLGVLLPPFEQRNHCKVDVIAVGTGKALKLGEAGDVDAVLVHARKLEDKFVASGYGINRRDIMYNDFIIIGPASDPAGVRSARTSAEALLRIRAKESPFISRGDESGTHQKEKELWQAAGVKPAGNWYLETGQGMGEVIIMTTQRQGYTLADRGTYNAFKKNKTDLVILFQGEKGLFNPYGAIAVNPKRYPHARYDLAMKFIDYLTGKEGQKIITDFRVNGEPLFFVYR
ncbi:MAG: tungsten ABC transporter substrate-binding protein [Geobacter sp.]|nr:tungsten ABC transporter substrate-binding protein [Geobacter sp.]